MSILRYFEAYVKAGLRVIPLYKNAKVPVFDNWYTDWDEEKCKHYIMRYPQSNIGLLLGEIIDVEGDTKEANNTLNRLIGKYKHPTYTSAKSTHHLFLNPYPELTIWKKNGIEFRANKHQSVLPPSNHFDGTRYYWLGETAFPIPPMPESLLEYYNFQKNLKSLIKPGHMQIWCSACHNHKFIHSHRYKLEIDAFKSHKLQWECNKCRQLDIRGICKKMKTNFSQTQMSL